MTLGQDYQANGYVGNGDATVSDSITDLFTITDRASGLMWQKADSVVPEIHKIASV